MRTISVKEKSNLFYSCSEQEHRSVESNVSEHVAIHIFSGSLSVTNLNGSYLIKENETALFPKNMLGRFIKYPSDSTPFKSISVAFSRSFLQEYYSANEIAGSYTPKMEIHKIQINPLIISLFNSILPYEHLENGDVPHSVTNLKLQEAITVLRSVDPSADNIFANFSQEGKVDLLDYMEKNYMFNIPMHKFAYLTGRSLSTFKRDFEKVFNTTPQRWLLQKRLQKAYFLIHQENRKPSEVYLEIGFENLSHFSRSFKQYFGVNPSKVK